MYLIPCGFKSQIKNEKGRSRMARLPTDLSGVLDAVSVTVAVNESVSKECPSSSTITLDDLKNGDLLQCSTRMQNFAGQLLSVDRRKGIFVLSEQKGTERQFDIHFVCFAKLQSLKKLSSDCAELFHLSLDSPRAARESEAAKRTFIELKRIFDDVVWEGEGIKVLKCILVIEPYDENGVKCLDSRTSSISALARVKKILGQRAFSSSRLVPLPQQCVSPSSSTPSTLVQPDYEEQEAMSESDRNLFGTLPTSAVVDLFLDASQSEEPKSVRRKCSSPLRSPLCCSSSEELEMVTPPTMD
uniref:AD domain-containing protein n=1 Tax=Globodera rostochiensis TaxID=31243 RepID=A0A914H1L1_GLORO